MSAIQSDKEVKISAASNSIEAIESPKISYVPPLDFWTKNPTLECPTGEKYQETVEKWQKAHAAGDILIIKNKRDRWELHFWLDGANNEEPGSAGSTPNIRKIELSKTAILAQELNKSVTPQNVHSISTSQYRNRACSLLLTSDEESLLDAAWRGDIVRIRDLLERKKISHDRCVNEWDAMPIHQAAFNAKPEALSALLSYDPNLLEVRTGGGYGWTPLAMAMYSTHTNLVQKKAILDRLADNNCDPDSYKSVPGIEEPTTSHREAIQYWQKLQSEKLQKNSHLRFLAEKNAVQEAKIAAHKDKIKELKSSLNEKQLASSPSSPANITVNVVSPTSQGSISSSVSTSTSSQVQAEDSVTRPVDKKSNSSDRSALVENSFLSQKKEEEKHPNSAKKSNSTSTQQKQQIENMNGTNNLAATANAAVELGTNEETIGGDKVTTCCSNITCTIL